jgi:hypothetical protein
MSAEEIRRARQQAIEWLNAKHTPMSQEELRARLTPEATEEEERTAA